MPSFIKFKIFKPSTILHPLLNSTSLKLPHALYFILYQIINIEIFFIFLFTNYFNNLKMVKIHITLITLNICFEEI